MSTAGILPQATGDAPGGAYAQPTPGIVLQAVIPTDVTGVQLAGAAGTASAAVVTVQGIAGATPIAFASSASTTASVQGAAQASAPTAGTAVVTLTTPAAGTYEVTGLLSISGTTVVAADSNNFNLKKGATTLLTNIPIAVNGITGAPGAVPFGPVVVVLDGSTSLTVNAVGSATGSSIYAAALFAKRTA